MPSSGTPVTKRPPPLPINVQTERLRRAFEMKMIGPDEARGMAFIAPFPVQVARGEAAVLVCDYCGRWSTSIGPGCLGCGACSFHGKAVPGMVMKLLATGQDQAKAMEAHRVARDFATKTATPFAELEQAMVQMSARLGGELLPSVTEAAEAFSALAAICRNSGVPGWTVRAQGHPFARSGKAVRVEGWGFAREIRKRWKARWRT